MGKSINVAERKIKAAIKIEKGQQNTWIVTPEFVASSEEKPPGNFIFIIDCSDSMGWENNLRLNLVKKAINLLLDKLDIHDQLSVITFNADATCLIKKQIITSQEDIAEVKTQIGGIVAQYQTNFAPAFEAIVEHDLISPAYDSSIIFLSDGAGKDIEDDASPANLIKLIRTNNKKSLLIPIGISVKDKHLSYLNELTRQANPHIKPILIDDDKIDDYRDAFEQAFALAIEQSQKKIRLDVLLEANDKNQPSRHESTRELAKLYYDNETPNSDIFLFQSPAALTSCKVRFICDDIHLAFNRQFKPNELPEQLGASSRFQIDKIEWKDSTSLSWLKCSLKLLLGLAIVGTCVAFSLITTPASIAVFIGLSFLAKMTGISWVIGGLVSIPGLLLLGSGLVDLAHKTVSWKTKLIVPTNNDTSTQEALKHLGNSSVPQASRHNKRAQSTANELHSQPHVSGRTSQSLHSSTQSAASSYSTPPAKRKLGRR